MELLSKKVLVFLCTLFFMAASAEGFLLLKSRNNNDHRSYNRFGFDIFSPQVEPVSRDFFDPWKDLNDGFLNLNKGFFTGNLNRTFTMSGPREERTTNDVRLIFDVKGHEKADFKINVRQGQLTVTGKDALKEEKKPSGENVATSEVRWSQTQSFPLPNDADPKNYTVERNGDELTIIFKKLKVANKSSSYGSYSL